MADPFSSWGTTGGGGDPFSDWGGPKLTYHPSSSAGGGGGGSHDTLWPNFISHAVSAVVPDFIERPVVHRGGSIGTGIEEAIGSIPGSAKTAARGFGVAVGGFGHDIMHDQWQFYSRLAHGDPAGAFTHIAEWSRHDAKGLVVGMADDLIGRRLNLNQILAQDIPGLPAWRPWERLRSDEQNKRAAAVRKQGFPSLGEWAGPALDYSFHQDPFGTALWLLPGVTKLGEVRLARAAARGDPIATTSRTLQKPGWEQDVNPSITLRDAKTLEGRKMQRAFDQWSEQHPGAPLIGSAARVRRIAAYRAAVETGMAKVMAMARNEQRLMSKLTPDELNATLVVASGSRTHPDPIAQQVAYFEGRKAKMEALAAQGVKGAAESSAAIGVRLELLNSIPREVIEHPRPEFLAWYRHYAKMDEVSTETMIELGNLERLSADQRRVLEQRLYSGGRPVPLAEATAQVRNLRRASARPFKEATKLHGKVEARLESASRALATATARLQRAEDSLRRATARGAAPGPARTELFVERRSARQQVERLRIGEAKARAALADSQTRLDIAEAQHNKAQAVMPEEHWVGGEQPGRLIERDYAAVGLARQRPVVHQVDVQNPAIERETVLIDRQTGEVYRGGGTHHELAQTAGIDLRHNLPDGSHRYIQAELHPGVNDVFNGKRITIPRHWVIPYSSASPAEVAALAPRLQAIENLPVSFDIHAEMIPKASIPGEETIVPGATTRKTERGANNVADKLTAAGHENVSVERTGPKEWSVTWDERKVGPATPIEVGPLALFGPAVRDPHMTFTSTEEAGFYTRVKSAAMNPPQAIGSLKKNRALMFASGLLSMNPARFSIDFMQQMRYARMMDRFTSEVLPFGKEIDPALPGGHIESVENGGKGIAYIRTRGKRVPRPVRQLTESVTDLHKYLDGGDAEVKAWADDYVFTKIPDEFAGLDESTALRSMAEQGIQVIPLEAKRLLWDSELQATSKAVRVFWDRGFMHVWRNLVLTLKGGWLVNNAVTAAAFYGLNYAGRDGLQSFTDAMAAMPDGAVRLGKMRRFLQTLRGTAPPREAMIAIDNSEAVVLHMAGFAASDLRAGTPRAGRHAPTERAMLLSLSKAARKGYTAQRLTMKPIRAISKWVVDTNARIEDVFRDASMIAETRQYLRSVGETNRTFEKVLTEIQGQGKATPEQLRTLIDGVFDSQGNFDNLTPFERGVMRRYLFPFYSWYKNVLIITAKFIRDEPARALIVNQLSMAAANSSSMSFLFPHPAYASYQNISGNQSGVVTGLSWAGANPFQTPIDIYDSARSLFGVNPPQARTGQAGPANLLGPVPQALVTGLTGIDPFTGGTYAGPGVKQGKLFSAIGSVIDVPQMRLLEQLGIGPFDRRSKLYETEQPVFGGWIDQQQFDGILQFLGVPIRHVIAAEARRRAATEASPFSSLTVGSNPTYSIPSSGGPFSSWGGG